MPAKKSQVKKHYIVLKNFSVPTKDGDYIVKRSNAPQELKADAVKQGNKVKALKDAA